MTTLMEINTRLQKGGALLSEMRRLVAAWPPPDGERDVALFVMRTLAKTSLSRARDIYFRVFRPRFVDGNPHEAWRLARVLEDFHAASETARAFYLWLSARADPVLYGYVTTELIAEGTSTNRQVGVEDAMQWLNDQLDANRKKWSPNVTRKVARGMLAALRDFGVLQGTVVKTIAPIHCSLDAVALIAFCLNDLGASGRALLGHSDWRLFLLDSQDIERAFIECDQRGWLRYYAAGAICRVDFPCATLKEYARVVLG